MLLYVFLKRAEALFRERAATTILELRFLTHV